MPTELLWTGNSEQLLKPHEKGKYAVQCLLFSSFFLSLCITKFHPYYSMQRIRKKNPTHLSTCILDVICISVHLKYGYICVVSKGSHWFCFVKVDGTGWKWENQHVAITEISSHVWSVIATVWLVLFICCASCCYRWLAVRSFSSKGIMYVIILTKGKVETKQKITRNKSRVVLVCLRHKGKKTHGENSFHIFRHLWVTLNLLGYFSKNYIKTFHEVMD